MSKGRGNNPGYAKFMKNTKTEKLNKLLNRVGAPTGEEKNEDTNKHDYANSREAVSDAKNSMKKMNRIKTG